MLSLHILLFLAVLISSSHKSSPAVIRHGASSNGEVPVPQGTSYLDQDTRKSEGSSPFSFSQRDVGDDPKGADDNPEVIPDPLVHTISRRQTSKGDQKNTTKQDTVENTGEDQNACEHQLESSSGILFSYAIDKSLSCRWNISASEDSIVNIAILVLEYNDTSLAIAESAGNLCLENGTFIIFEEFLPDFQPQITVFCEVKSANTRALTLITVSNRVSISVYTQQDPDIVWALWYQIVDESLFYQEAYDSSDVGSGEMFTELKAVNSSLLEKISDLNADQCFEIDEMMLSPKKESFGISENCSLTFLPDGNEELMLSLISIGLSNATVANCTSDNAFITIRSWKPDGYANETLFCSIPLFGARFQSPVRIELLYHPSAVTRQDFKAQISIVEPDLDITQLLDALLQNTLLYSLSGDNGSLSSLGYPMPFPSMRMIWEITVGKGKEINLEFVDIDFGYEPPSICNETTPILFIISSPIYDKEDIYCGSLPPWNITSYGGKMSLIFDPKAGNIGRGLQAVFSSFDLDNDTYQANLGLDDAWSLLQELPIPPSMLYAPARIFEDCELLFMNYSRNFSNNVASNENLFNFSICQRILSTPFDFIEDLLKNTTLFDYLDKNGGSMKPINFTSGNQFEDDFDKYRGNFGFNEDISSSPRVTTPSTQPTDVSLISNVCDKITKDSGKFSTLFYPNDYPVNYTACWYIMTNPSRYIVLQLRNFSLDSARIDPCDTSYSHVVINDFVLDAVFLCGEFDYRKIESSRNSIQIEIKGKLGQGQGFYAVFETFEIPQFRSHVATGEIVSCNATEHLESLAVSGTARLPALMSKCSVDGTWLEWFTESDKESGWIASPMFPWHYPAGSHCVWIIRGEGNVMVKLDFFDFDLGEVPGTYPPCSEADTFILIRDCVSGEEKTLCGVRTENEEVMIHSNSVEIEFYSQGGQGKGFHAFYKLRQSTIEGQQLRILPENLTSVPSFHGREDTTTKESQPSKFPVSTLPPKSLVSDPVCDVISSDECGATIRSEFGYFSYAFYPQELLSQTDCIWAVESSLPDHQIALKILDNGMGAPVIDGKCDTRYGYIRVDISGNYAYICNNRGQNLFLSDAGFIRIELSSEYSVGRGFCASFMSLNSTFNGSIDDLQFPCSCENIFTNYSWIGPSVEPPGQERCEFAIGEGSGTFPSGSFPIPYPPNFECVWTLLADQDENVNLQFMSLDLDGFRMSGRRRCLLTDTHVQITLFTGTKVLNERFCSDDDWSVAIPPSRDVTIKFKSGDTPAHNHTGFVMAYNFTRAQSKDMADNKSVSESSEDIFGFRAVIDYDGFSPLSSDDYSEEVVVETGRRTTEGDRTRLTWPIEVETEIPDLGLFTDFATELPDVYGTELPEGHETTTGYTDEGADILTTTERLRGTYSLEEVTTRSSTSQTLGVIPGRGRMTAREMELTIYICTAFAAFFIIVLILVTLYCAKNRRSKSKAGFDIDAADEANYWQTYKDWAKDWVTEPVAGSAQSTVGAMCGDESGMAPKCKPSTGGGAMATELSPDHRKTVSAVVNQPPIDKPERNFIPSEKLV
nr:uncharacterized protein LOC129265147 isoform X1 [Lytechinus pictus]